MILAEKIEYVSHKAALPVYLRMASIPVYMFIIFQLISSSERIGLLELKGCMRNQIGGLKEWFDIELTLFYISGTVCVLMLFESWVASFKQIRQKKQNIHDMVNEIYEEMKCSEGNMKEIERLVKEEDSDVTKAIIVDGHN